MILNEKGFMYPLSMCLVLLFSIFVSVQIEQYVMDKKMVQQIEYYEKKHYYLLTSLKKVEQWLVEDPSITSGTLNYSEGTVEYKVKPLTTSLLQISFQLNTGELRNIYGYGYYDKEVKKIVKWVEKS